MPVYSMTGYASATAGTPEAPTSTANSDHPVARTVTPARTSVTVELRSVNARFLDLSLRLPEGGVAAERTNQFRYRLAAAAARTVEPPLTRAEHHPRMDADRPGTVYQ